MNGYQIAIIMFATELGCSLGKHGEPKEGKHSFWPTLLWYGVLTALLVKGGFWSS